MIILRISLAIFFTIGLGILLGWAKTVNNPAAFAYSCVFSIVVFILLRLFL